MRNTAAQVALNGLKANWQLIIVHLFPLQHRLYELWLKVHFLVFVDFIFDNLSDDAVGTNLGFAVFNLVRVVGGLHALLKCCLQRVNAPRFD